MKLVDCLPGIEDVLLLEAEELAAYLMRYLNASANELQDPNSYSVNRESEIKPTAPLMRDYAGKRLDKVVRALMEAWSWLEREGLIIQDPIKAVGWLFISRRGRTQGTVGSQDRRA